MNFFVNATMPNQKSGIEHAQLKHNYLITTAKIHELFCAIGIRLLTLMRMQPIPDDQLIKYVGFPRGDGRNAEDVAAEDLDFVAGEPCWLMNQEKQPLLAMHKIRRWWRVLIMMRRC